MFGTNVVLQPRIIDINNQSESFITHEIHYSLFRYQCYASFQCCNHQRHIRTKISTHFIECLAYETTLGKLCQQNLLERYAVYYGIPHTMEDI